MGKCKKKSFVSIMLFNMLAIITFHLLLKEKNLHSGHGMCVGLCEESCMCVCMNVKPLLENVQNVHLRLKF